MSIDLTKVESCDMIRELNKRDAMPEPDLNDFTNEQLLQALGMVDDDTYDPTNWGRFYELFATGRGDEAVADFKKLVERKTERILP